MCMCTVNIISLLLFYSICFYCHILYCWLVLPGQKGHLLIIELVDQESNIEIEGENTDTSTHKLSNSSYSNKSVLLLNYYITNFAIACITLIYLLEILFNRSFFLLTHPFPSRLGTNRAKIQYKPVEKEFRISNNS